MNTFTSILSIAQGEEVLRRCVSNVSLICGASLRNLFLFSKGEGYPNQILTEK
jgi:hypothetical protein